MMEAWRNAVQLLPWEWATFEFMQNALLAVLLVSPLYALLGALVVNNRMAFFSDCIGHGAFTGLALGVLLGIGRPLWAMVAFAALLAAAITWFMRRSRVSPDTIISIFMSFTVSLGVVLLSRDGAFARYTPYLVGDLLSITPAEIAGIFGMLLIVALLYALFFNRLLLVSLNSTLALSRGVPVAAVQTVFAVLVAVAVTLNIRWVGILLVNALLILPAAAARNLARNSRQYVWGAVSLGLLCGVSGLLASYYFSTATGATIVLIAACVFALTTAMREWPRGHRAAARTLRGVFTWRPGRRP